MRIIIPNVTPTSEFTNRTTHGMRYSSEYSTWRGMKTRCYWDKFHQYADYGGRGIKVCERWKNSFSEFLKDMGMKPFKSHTLERRNNDGDYCPENCYWATRIQQGNNSRKNRMVTAFGKTQSISMWSREKNWAESVIRQRLNRGWDSEKSISFPWSGNRPSTKRILTP